MGAEEASQMTQIDAEFDDECCEMVRRYLIQQTEESLESGIELMHDDNQLLSEWLKTADCGEVMGHYSRSFPAIIQIYNQCANSKMVHPDITTGEPMDMVWRLLKHG